MLSADIGGFSEFKGSTLQGCFVWERDLLLWLVFNKVVVNSLPRVAYFIWKQPRFVGKSFFLESNRRRGEREREKSEYIVSI